jgi:single-strand DNA-binding protein
MRGSAHRGGAAACLLQHEYDGEQHTVANFNKVILMGNLTRDIELRHTQGGMAIAKFGMAINRRSSTKDGEQRESTCFVDMTAFGKSAELLNQYVRKGSPLFVEGRLEYSTWESQDGGKRNKLEVIVENFQFMSSGNREGGGGGGGGERRGGGRPQAQEAGGEVDYGDIPF